MPTLFRWLRAAAMACAALAVLPAAAHDHGAAGARWGLHGMVLFGGEDGLFAAHLPMFHAPHDVQMVFRLRFADAAIERTMRQELARERGLWTLVPQRFDLDRLAPHAAAPLRRFTADVVRGHFEQGGTVRRPAAEVEIVDMILYRPLDAAAMPAASAAEYRIVMASAGARERFLVKLVDRRPDVDHLVAIEGAAGWGGDRLFVAVTPGTLPDAAAVGAALRDACSCAPAAVRDIHRDTADLR